MTFTATCLGSDPARPSRDARTVRQRAVVAGTRDAGQAAAIEFDQFQRTIAQTMALLEVRAD